MTFPPARVKLNQMFSEQLKLGLGMEATYPVLVVFSAKSVPPANPLLFSAVKLPIKHKVRKFTPAEAKHQANEICLQRPAASSP